MIRRCLLLCLFAAASALPPNARPNVELQRRFLDVAASDRVLAREFLGVFEPVNHWFCGKWSAWSPCSVTCGSRSGYKMRYRSPLPLMDVLVCTRTHREPCYSDRDCPTEAPQAEAATEPPPTTTEEPTTTQPPTTTMDRDEAIEKFCGAWAAWSGCHQGVRWRVRELPDSAAAEASKKPCEELDAIGNEEIYCDGEDASSAAPPMSTLLPSAPIDATTGAPAETASPVTPVDGPLSEVCGPWMSWSPCDETCQEWTASERFRNNSYTAWWQKGKDGLNGQSFRTLNWTDIDPNKCRGVSRETRRCPDCPDSAVDERCGPWMGWLPCKQPCSNAEVQERRRANGYVAWFLEESRLIEAPMVFLSADKAADWAAVDPNNCRGESFDSRMCSDSSQCN